MNTNKVIIIGSGISGITIARLLAEANYEVHIYEKENFIGGHCHDYEGDKGILIHKFGPHIFHTSNERVWEFLNQFTKFNGYINQVKVCIDNQLVEMPINFNSIEALFGKEETKAFEEECKKVFGEQENVSIFDIKAKLRNKNSTKIADYIYKNVYENYTMKMWGISAEEIDKDILKRVKINLNRIWNYFPNDKYQGLPVDGYTAMFNKMLDHKNITLHLNQDAKALITFNKNKVIFDNDENAIVIYTGQIDDLFDYKYKRLGYRSLFIEFKTIAKPHFQEVGVINYPADPNITRITEYKYLTKQSKWNWTIISYETPGEYNPESPVFGRPFYPLCDEQNKKRAQRYFDLANKYENLHLLGRLSNYQYFDMDDAVEKAFEQFEKLIKKNTEE